MSAFHDRLRKMQLMYRLDCECGENLLRASVWPERGCGRQDCGCIKIKCPTCGETMIFPDDTHRGEAFLRSP